MFHSIDFSALTMSIFAVRRDRIASTRRETAKVPSTQRATDSGISYMFGCFNKDTALPSGFVTRKIPGRTWAILETEWRRA